MKTLNEWMDTNGITPDQAAEIFGKSVGTIRNWRSAGVPTNLTDWVDKRIVEWSGVPLPSLPDRVTLTVSSEQFDDWSRAALSEGKILSQWAIDSLDAVAAGEADSTGYDQASNPLHSLQVADEGKTYEPGPGSGSGDVISAPLGDIFQSGSSEGVA